MTQRAWIFTFGSDHRHPRTGEPLRDRYVTILADDYDQARAKMVTHFGLKWAFQYASPAEAGVSKYNLKEVDL